MDEESDPTAAGAIIDSGNHHSSDLRCYLPLPLSQPLNTLVCQAPITTNPCVLLDYLLFSLIPLNFLRLRETSVLLDLSCIIAWRESDL